MGFTPISVGDQSLLHSTFTTDSSSFPLTSVNVSQMSMHYIDTSNSTLRIGTGTWTITNASDGQADYAPSAADVATPGMYRLYPVIILSTGPKAFDPQTLEILNLL